MNAWLPAIVGVVNVGGWVAAIAALVKLRPEAGQLVVTAAEGVVAMQTAALARLEAENRLLRQRVELLETRLAKVERDTRPTD